MAKIIRSRDRSENMYFFFAFHDVYETCRAQHISDEVISTLNFNILVCYTAADLSGVVSIYFLRASTLMLPSATQATV